MRKRFENEPAYRSLVPLIDVVESTDKVTAVDYSDYIEFTFGNKWLDRISSKNPYDMQYIVLDGIDDFNDIDEIDDPDDISESTSTLKLFSLFICAALVPCAPPTGQKSLGGHFWKWCPMS